MRGDFGLTSVDVDNHARDDVQARYLPLQWAVDSVSPLTADGLQLMCFSELHRHDHWSDADDTAIMGVHKYDSDAARRAEQTL